MPGPSRLDGREVLLEVTIFKWFAVLLLLGRQVMELGRFACHSGKLDFNGFGEQVAHGLGVAWEGP